MSLGLRGPPHISSVSTGFAPNSVTLGTLESATGVPSRNFARPCSGHLNQSHGGDSDSVINQNYRANLVGSTSKDNPRKLEEWQLVPDEVLLYFVGDSEVDQERDTANFFRNIAKALRTCYFKLVEIKSSKHRKNVKQSSVGLVSVPSSSGSLSFSSDIQEPSLEVKCYNTNDWAENSPVRCSDEDDLKTSNATNSFSTITSTEESLSSVELIFPPSLPKNKDNHLIKESELPHEILSAEDLLLPYEVDNKEDMLFSLVQDFPFQYSDTSHVEDPDTFNTANEDGKVIDQQPKSLTFWSNLWDIGNGNLSDKRTDSSDTVSDTSPPISAEDFVRIKNKEEIKPGSVGFEVSSIQDSVPEGYECSASNGEKTHNVQRTCRQQNEAVRDVSRNHAKGLQKPVLQQPDVPQIRPKETSLPRPKRFWSDEEDKKDISVVKVASVPANDLVFHVNQQGAVKVGEGSFGSVYLADLFTKRAVYQVVVKDFSPKGVTKPIEILEEARILMHLLSTGFIPYFYGVLHMASPQRFALVQEFFGQGMSLHNLLEDKPVRLSQTSWLNLCVQMVIGIDMFHRKGILMNDIKKDNILVDCRDEQDCQLKFIDMGLASYKTGRVFYGSIDYMQQFTHLAPEVRHLKRTSPASDVYSLGKILYSIAKNVPVAPVKNIALPCLHQYPEHRPTVQELVHLLIDVIDNLDENSPLEFNLHKSQTEQRWFC